MYYFDFFQVNEIRRNVRDSIVTILQAMTNVDPPVTTSDPALDSTRTWLLEYNGRPEFDYNTEFYEATESLWADAGVQQCFERSNEYQLIDCAKYFLDKVSEVKRDEFNPRLVFFPSNSDDYRILQKCQSEFRLKVQILVSEVKRE